MLKNVESDVKFVVQNDDFQRRILFITSKIRCLKVKYFTRRTNDDRPESNGGYFNPAVHNTTLGVRVLLRNSTPTVSASMGQTSLA